MSGPEFLDLRVSRSSPLSSSSCQRLDAAEIADAVYALDLVPLSAEVLDAAFEHVANRLAARAAVMRGRTGPVTMGQSATRFGLNGVGSTNGAG